MTNVCYCDMRKLWTRDNFGDVIESDEFEQVVREYFDVYGYDEPNDEELLKFTPLISNAQCYAEFDSSEYTNRDIEWWAVHGDCVEVSHILMPKLLKIVYNFPINDMYVLEVDFSDIHDDSHCVLTNLPMEVGTTVPQIKFGLPNEQIPNQVIIYDPIYSVYRPPLFGTMTVLKCCALPIAREAFLGYN